MKSVITGQSTGLASVGVTVKKASNEQIIIMPTHRSHFFNLKNNKCALPKIFDAKTGFFLDHTKYQDSKPNFLVVNTWVNFYVG